MGREVRMVPSDWQHPVNNGEPDLGRKPRYRPLLRGPWSERAAAWDEENAQWERGFEKDYSYNPDVLWKPKASDRPSAFEEWRGPRPKQENYMPEWSDAEATHLMMYEDTTEGTPISPAFATPEELAHWLADNGASACGYDTATYEQWLPTCRNGWAPSMIIDSNGVCSGVVALANIKASL